MIESMTDKSLFDQVAFALGCGLLLIVAVGVVSIAWWIFGRLVLRALPWGAKRPWYTASLRRWIVTPTGVLILFVLGGPLTVLDLPGELMRGSTLKRKKREDRESIARIQSREAQKQVRQGRIGFDKAPPPA